MRSGKSFSTRIIFISLRPWRGSSGRTRRSAITGSSTTHGGRSPIARPGGRSRKRIGPTRRGCLAIARRALPRSKPIARPCEAGTGWSRTRGTPTRPPTNTMSSSASLAPSTPRRIGPCATAYRAAMKIASRNYVKDPSATSWRDKAEDAERASVVAGRQPEPPLRRQIRFIRTSCVRSARPRARPYRGPGAAPAVRVTPPPSAPGRGRREYRRYARCRSTAAHNRPSRRSLAALPA